MMQRLLCVALIIAQLYTTVCGLQCYQCSYAKLLTGFDLLDQVLNQFLKIIKSDEACLLKESDITKINAKTCPPPKAGKTTVCSKINGTITFSTSLIAVKYSTVTRDCNEVDVGSDRAQSVGQCYVEDANSDTLKKVADEFFKGLDVSSFTGNACYYKDSLGSELYPAGVNMDRLKKALQCYACSYNKILTGNDIINQITKLVSKVASDKQCLMTNDDDIYDINSKTCPEPSSEDKTQRCAIVRGNITFAVSGYTVVYQTTSRDCVEVDKNSDQASTSDECYPEDRESSSLQTIVNNYFEGFQMSNFHGESCYYDRNLASETAPEGVYIGEGIKVTGSTDLIVVISLSVSIMQL